MEKITPDAIAELLERPQNGPAVTIYVPMHRSAAPPHMTEDQIRLKNLVREATELLHEREGGDEIAHQLDMHLRRLLDDQHFWEKQTEALLLCAQDGLIRMFQLPLETEEYVAVDETFHLTPVLSFLHDDVSFYVLAIAQHNPRLFIGDAYGLRPSGIELPTNIDAALGIDERPKGEQSLSAGGSSMHTAAFNGRGGAHDSSDDNVARFLRIVDHAITTADTSGRPLILAGIDSETAAYKAISKYPRIVEKTVSGNFNNQPLEVLFSHAHPIAEAELVAPKRHQALETYNRLSGTNPDRTANDESHIASAVEQGRVDTLLLGMSRVTTDTVQDSLQPVKRITFPKGSLAHAINKLALKVQDMSGRIVVVDESQMPNRAPMAAVLRY